MDETRFSSGSMYSSGEEDLLAREGLRLSRAVRWRERNGGQDDRHVTFEPAVFLFWFALSLSEIELTHQILYQTCRVQGYPQTDCLLVGTNASLPGVQEIEAQVRPAAASVSTAIVVIKSVMPIFGTLLLGAWSDRYGRKPVAVITVCGLLLTYFTFSGLNYLSSFVQVNPWYYVLAYIPFSIPGGMAILGATIFAFVSDVSNDDNRTVKMGFVKASMLAGSTLGTFSSRYLLEWTHPIGIFVIATICILVGLIYVMLFVEDSMIPAADNELGTSLEALFSPSLIRDIVQAASRKRSRFVWPILGLIVVCATLTELATSDSAVAHLYTRRIFEWNRRQFALFMLTENGLAILANVLGIAVLKKVLDWPDTLIALLSITSFIICSTVKAFATAGWQFFLATGLTFPKGMEQVALLSVCAYLLPSNEIATFYGLATFVIGLAPLAAGPLFAYFYQETVESEPEAYNFLAAGMAGIGFLVLVMIQWLLNKRHQPQLLL